MVQIHKLERGNARSQRVHEPVEGQYFVFDGADGKRYIQIDTYGSVNRKLKGKQSQTIQFDHVSAANLVAILRAEFALP